MQTPGNMGCHSQYYDNPACQAGRDGHLRDFCGLSKKIFIPFPVMACRAPSAPKSPILSIRIFLIVEWQGMSVLTGPTRPEVT